MRRSRSGSVAVEFAMIGPLLFGLIITTFDAGGVMYKTMLLERAADLATRPIRLGSAGAATDATALKTQICGKTILSLGDCVNRLTIEMTVVKAKADIPTADVACVTKSVPKPTVKYSAGGLSELVYVRACLTVDPFVPLVAETYGLKRNSNGDYSIIAVTTYTNEP
ncbi:TadE/TadG family type IV pilus assembly protein [Methylopila sp. M107]|uniref:TadE/TadG family type IV pilus assembly protein n=1 Tax=Methylopila sp. M107 TaxID=1101190 RepID=UPI00058C2F05|nr:TadE/TadG family type IV pilus assembly protein [Methylopila sp. M107]